MSKIQAGFYRHYKGGRYQILGVGRHSETEEEVVVYRQLYGDFALWVRPAAMFSETVTVDGAEMPRFQFVSRRYVPSLLTKEAQARAARWIADHARPLERARYAFHFAGGSAEAVLDELRAFQNSDGGFGHGLEPDLQTADSSIIGTTVALQLLRELEVGETHPMVRGAMSYLRTQYSEEFDYWPIVPPTVENAPHAPWWQARPVSREQAGAQFINPRAEIVGYHFAYPSYTTPEFRNRLLESELAWLSEKGDALEMHELLCALRLSHAPGLPESTRQELEQNIAQIILATVSTEPSEWGGYVLRPLDVIDGPDSPLLPSLGDAPALDLDVRIEQQEADGAWSPPWSWGNQFPEGWARAEQEWRGVLTLNMLMRLARFGRLTE